MEKAYDLKVLGERLTAAGVPVLAESAEEVGKKAYDVIKGWAKESAVLSENKVDDFVAPFYDQLDPLVLPAIDKIDGQVG